jgi:hypothetical protein
LDMYEILQLHVYMYIITSRVTLLCMAKLVLD